MAKKIEGTDEDDTLRGERYLENHFYGYEGDDVLFGGRRNDVFFDDQGNDVMFGSRGVDTVVYSSNDKAGGVQVYLNGYSATSGYAYDQWGTMDTLYHIENVQGTAYNDILWGSSVANTFWGFGGRDTFYGHGGNDTMYGHAGDDYFREGDGNDSIFGGAGDRDKVSYKDVGYAVTVDLGDERATGGGYTDTLKSIEQAEGSRYNDYIEGSSVDNKLYGSGGDDLIVGRGGDDYINGGSGLDAASYKFATGAVEVDLAARTGHGRYSEAGVGEDRFYSVENAIGSNHGDLLKGSSGDNELFGLGGNDELRGGKGSDYLSGHGGNDTLNGGDGNDEYRGGGNSDTFVFEGRNFGIDTVLDFSSVDQIVLDDVIDSFRDIDTDGNGVVNVNDASTGYFSGNLYVSFGGVNETIVFVGTAGIAEDDFTIL